MTVFAEYGQYDALGLAELVRTRQVTVPELVETAIERIETHNPALNAVVCAMYDHARAAAQAPLPDGPFAGVPFLLKDMYATVAGVPTSCATRLLKNLPQKSDNEMIRRYKAAGLIFVGKTNLSEFSILPYTEPALFGPTHNPWDLARTPGGSSGGSAAAVAAGCVPMAGAADGGGSIRIPASCCGIFGLKPTRGRTPTGPEVADIWRGFAQEHVVTRTVRDSAAMLDALAAPETDAPYWAPPQARPYLEESSTPPGRLRIAFTARPFLGEKVDIDCEKGLAATVRLLEELGHEVVEDAPPIDKERFALSFMTMVAAETRDEIERTSTAAGVKISFNDFEPATGALALVGQAMNAGQYAKALNYLMAAGRKVNQFFGAYDILLTPTLAIPPFITGALQLSRLERFMIRPIAGLKAAWLLNMLGIIKQAAEKTFGFIPFTPVFNVTGQPAMSVPLHWNHAGLPIGMHFVGRFGDEATLFRLAGQLEKARPWFSRVPPGF